MRRVARSCFGTKTAQRGNIFCLSEKKKRREVEIDNLECENFLSLPDAVLCPINLEIFVLEKFMYGLEEGKGRVETVEPARSENNTKMFPAHSIRNSVWYLHEEEPGRKWRGEVNRKCSITAQSSDFQAAPSWFLH